MPCRILYNGGHRSKLEKSSPAPLTEWDDGSIRIAGSRVPIDTVVHHFNLGATAEEIGYKFPSLQLSDIYGAIYYYLANRERVEEYLSEQAVQGDAVQQRIESEPEYRAWRADMVKRMLARQIEQDRPQTY